jgi:L-fuculose-phosphate aldolase
MAAAATHEEAAARTAVVATAQAMSRLGLSPGRSGNVSRRWATGFLITPSGVAYGDLAPDAVVFVADDGSVAGRLKPSSEWQMHRAIYRARPDRHAIVHTHSLHAIVLAAHGRPIPAFHYMVAMAGGVDIPCVGYATFGTDDLARIVADGVRDRDACLMAHHGQVAIGADLQAALELAADVETLAEQYVKALSIGTPRILPDEEMHRVVAKFSRYGQRAQAQPDDGAAAKKKRKT